MKTKFFTSMAIFIGAAIMFGVVLPWLISAESTIAVVAGLVIMLAIFASPIFYVMSKNEKEKE